MRGSADIWRPVTEIPSEVATDRDGTAVIDPAADFFGIPPIGDGNGQFRQLVFRLGRGLQFIEAVERRVSRLDGDTAGVIRVEPPMTRIGQITCGFLSPVSLSLRVAVLRACRTRLASKSACLPQPTSRARSAAVPCRCGTSRDLPGAADASPFLRSWLSSPPQDRSTSRAGPLSPRPSKTGRIAQAVFWLAGAPVLTGNYIAIS